MKYKSSKCQPVIWSSLHARKKERFSQSHRTTEYRSSFEVELALVLYTNKLPHLPLVTFLQCSHWPGVIILVWRRHRHLWILRVIHVRSEIVRLAIRCDQSPRNWNPRPSNSGTNPRGWCIRWSHEDVTIGIMCDVPLGNRIIIWKLKKLENARSPAVCCWCKFSLPPLNWDKNRP